jgi:hypothetical protein
MYNHVVRYIGCLKNSFTTLKEYINLFRGYVQCFEMCKCKALDFEKYNFTRSDKYSLHLPYPGRGLDDLPPFSAHVVPYVVIEALRRAPPSQKSYARGTETF